VCLWRLRAEPCRPAHVSRAFHHYRRRQVSIHNGGLAVRVVDEAMGRFASRMDRLTAMSARGAAEGAAEDAKESAADASAAAEVVSAASAAEGEAAEAVGAPSSKAEAGATAVKTMGEDSRFLRVLTLADLDLEDHFSALSRRAALAKAEAEVTMSCCFRCHFDMTLAWLPCLYVLRSQ